MQGAESRAYNRLMNISAQREWLSNRLDPISEEQFVEFMKIVLPDSRTVNTDYEDA